MAVHMSFLRVLNISFLSVVTLLGTFGNCFVLFVIYNRKDLHTWTFLLLAHLALSDLIICSVCAPVWISIYATGEFGFCVTGLAISVISFAVSVSTLSIIAYERYAYIKDPFSYSQKITKRKLIIILSIVWILSILSIVPVTNGAVFRRDANYLVKKNCILNQLLSKAYTFYAFGCIVVAPSIILSTVYALIYRVAMKQRRKIQCSFSGNHDRARRLSSGRQYKTFFMLFLIVGSFAIFLIPYPIFCLIDVYCEDCIQYYKHKYLYLLSGLYFVNSSLNPILYSIGNKQFRRGVKRTIMELLGYPHIHRDSTLSSYSKAVATS